MSFPRFHEKLPELAQFTRSLADAYRQSLLSDWVAFKERVQTFYTPAMMAQIESFVPGWTHMATYAAQQTLIHVTSVFVALYVLPEYQAATPEQQAIMEWEVLFHDVAKRAAPNKHDYIHAFRSAALTGPALAPLGFPTSADFAVEIAAWQRLTDTATVYDPAYAEDKQDNLKLPEIIAGIEHLYGASSPAALIIKGVLLHLSIYSDPNYPTVSPLTPDEISQYIDAAFYPILKVMMLVDNDSWELFNRENRRVQRDKTLAAFDNVARIINIA